MPELTFVRSHIASHAFELILVASRSFYVSDSRISPCGWAAAPFSDCWFPSRPLESGVELTIADTTSYFSLIQPGREPHRDGASYNRDRCTDICSRSRLLTDVKGLFPSKRLFGTSHTRVFREGAEIPITNGL